MIALMLFVWPVHKINTASRFPLQNALTTLVNHALLMEHARSLEGVNIAVVGNAYTGVTSIAAGGAFTPQLL
jgi:hypothetical protein